MLGLALSGSCALVSLYIASYVGQASGRYGNLDKAPDHIYRRMRIYLFGSFTLAAIGVWVGHAEYIRSLFPDA